ncbi:hypothetical protein DXA07_12005 [Clostridium sp. AM54-37XD]|nr:hypothetical protein DXA07_12005 [Clostridium sp. AM54-37XD]RHP93876.1 hypothetical protein DXA00_12055 [Clostridium sp. AM54-14XD]
MIRLLADESIRVYFDRAKARQRGNTKYLRVARRKRKPVRGRKYEVFASVHGKKENPCEGGNTKYLRVARLRKIKEKLS